MARTSITAQRGHRWTAALLVGAIMLAPFALAAQNDDQQRQQDKVNYLELAARLVADGNYGRAASALRSVDPQAKGLDVARYHTLRGLIALRQNQARQAIESLNKALAERQAKPKDARTEGDTRAGGLAHVYLAQAYYQLKQFDKTLTALDRAGEVGAEIVELQELRAQAHWKLGDRVAAFAALNRGGARFTDDHRFMRRKIFYLMDLGFYRQAARLGRRYLKIADVTPDDYLAIGRALRESDQLTAAERILERARLRYPRNRKVSLELAHVYLDRDSVSVAAELFAQAAVYHRDILPEAAELQRRAGHLYRALLLNSGVADQKKKATQRLAILVGMKRWAQAAAMGETLRRQGALADGDLRYAYAYALFKDGDYAASEQALVPLEQGKLFDQAVELRRAIAKCRQARWRCLS